MTMQPSIRIFHRNTYNQSWGTGELVTLYPSGLIPADATFVSVDEYDSIKIEFESNNMDDCLYIDHFSDDIEKVLRPGDSETVIRLNDTNNMPAPGHYSMRVEGPSGVWESLYLVEPRHLEWEYIHSMRKYLEDKVSGVTYDLIRRRSGMWGPEIGHGVVWFNMYRSIMEKFGNIRRHTELIIASPPEDVEKTYNLHSTSRNPDSKSIRWLQSRGLKRNAIIHQPSVFYEKRSVLTLDILENRWLLWFLRFLERQINDILMRFEMYQSSKNDEVLASSAVLQELQIELDSFSTLKYQNAFKNRNHGLNGRILEEKKKRDRLLHEASKFDANVLELKRMKGWLSRTIHDSWLSQVGEANGRTIPSLRLRKDQRFNALHRIYVQLKENLKRDMSAKKITYPHLGTAKLMEVYTVCLISDILQEQGWLWESGWVAGFNTEIPTFSELKSGDELRFHLANGYRLQLIYDGRVQRFASEEHIGFVATSQNDRPDVLLALYDSKSVFIKAMIIEVKHRNYVYLIHPQAKKESTDVNEQLKAYAHFTYIPPEKEIKRDAIDRVVCVYPKQDRGSAYEERYRKMIRLIQILPSDAEDKKAVGYELLSEQINEFINQNVQIVETM
ncbi:DUF2357 domain-containing protein (plasmid) [Paenibacillus rhizovicinus]|uniref:DUF2357 domain-containing protein n=1 Tax=Paenibacillus rhizovicinus TaxID=2704463 RepID=A0A6C0PAF7_9BACL|nr:DUF2357 domain-containing protein [Paenibacillus rhizovicinus]QHW35479.1 DUF2357 domain-containing protein [Paenibacillus rhizovicinus]